MQVSLSIAGNPSFHKFTFSAASIMKYPCQKYAASGGRQKVMERTFLGLLAIFSMSIPILDGPISSLILKKHNLWTTVMPTQWITGHLW